MSSIKDRFWSKVNKKGTFVRPRIGRCWEWTAAVDPKTGYGRFGVTSKNVVNAHSMSWRLSHLDEHGSWGTVPEGLCVLHHCDNRKCVRPSHLHLGSKADNMREMIDRGRAIHARGEQSSRALLSEKDVLDIRAETRTRGYRIRLASRYGVSVYTIDSIVKKRTWAWLT